MKQLDAIKNFIKSLSNMKTRSLLIVMGVVLVVAIILVWTALRTDQNQVLSEVAKTKRIRPIESLPGAGEASPIYDPLQEQENVQRAQEALQTGGSTVARLINQPKEGYGRGGFGEFDDGTGRCGEECYDQSGYDAQGYDRNGFDKDGYDKRGYNENGYDKNGFDRQGYDKDGYDKDGYDRFGYDRDGYDRNGCNRQGLNREGKPCKEANFAEDCFNLLGFDVNGCDRNGLNPDGKACYDEDGYNPEGYDKCGYDRDGFNKDGFDRLGCNRQGLDKNGQPCYDANGMAKDGYDRLGYDANGYDKSGYNKDGYDKDGYDKDGYDKDGYDRNGCNREGLNREGKACYDKQGFTDAGFDKQGYNRGGYDKNGFDRSGFDKNGYDADGYDRQGYDKDGYDKDGYDRNGCNREGLNRQGQPCVVKAGDETLDLLRRTEQAVAPVDAARTASEQYQRLLQEQQALDAQRQAELTRQQQEELLAQQQARMDAFEQLMNNQARAILDAWKPGKQTYVQTQKKEEPVVQPVAGGNTGGLAEYGQGPLIHKAGDIVFGIIDTSINSDEPGPVLARIVSGPLKGSKILGTFQRQEKKLYLQFNTLSVPDVPQSIGMNAIAIDPETARTAIASNVDNHYLLRYGSLIGSSFLQGMGEAVQSSLGTPELTNENGAIVASQAAATTRDQIIMGLGKVGQRIGEEIDFSSIPPTVTLDSGTGVGILIMADLRIEKPKEEAPPQTQQQSANNQSQGFSAVQQANVEAAAQAAASAAAQAVTQVQLQTNSQRE